MSDQGPTVFKDRYEVHRKLARGGMSDVYLARDRVLDRPVALKVLFPEYAKDATFVARFRREAQAAARLNQPNIVGVYDWGEEAGTYFIAMEYIEGRTLSEIVRAEGPLHPRLAAEVIADVAGALGFAHRNGVIHRDIKPGNVMVETSGLVKVADFGIAQAIGGPEQTQLTRVGSVMGTATYFSPEQAQGRQVDPRTDLYSLGCVLFEILTGRPPFTGETPVAIAYKHVQEPPPRPSTLVQVPPGLDAIVLKCLAKDPNARYATAEDLRTDLRRFLEGHPVSALAGAAAAGATAGYAAAEPTAAFGAPVTGTSPAYGDATTAVPATGGYPVAPTGAGVAYGQPPGARKKPNPWLIGVLVVLLLLVAGGLIALIMTTLSEQGNDTVRVPRLVDLTYEQAEAELQRLKLVAQRTDAPNEEKAKGIVFDQDPAAGDNVNEGATVILTVSSGQQTFPVPDVGGLTRDEARARLDEQFIVKVTEEASDTVDEDRVIRQDPTAGTELPSRSTVTIYVSTGRGAIQVPDVSGLATSTAQKNLRDAGFSSFTVVQSPSDEIGQGRVIATDPAAGQTAAKDTPITLYESSGPESTTTWQSSTSTTTSTSTTRTTEPSTRTTSEG